MSTWVIPNRGRVSLAVEKSVDKENLLLALDAARKAGALRGDLATFRDLLASQVALEKDWRAAA